MVDQIAVAEFLTPTTVSTINVTSPLITETFKGAIILCSAVTADDTNEAHGLIGIGLIGVDNSAQENAAISCQAQNARVTNSNANSGHTATLCLTVPNNLGTANQIEASFNSAVAGGFSLDFTTVIATQIRCVAIIFAGVDKCAVGSASASTGGGTHEDVGSAGAEFQADLFVFLACDVQLTVGNQDGTLPIGFCVRDGTDKQLCGYWNTDDGVGTTDSDGVLRTDCAWTAFEGVRTDGPRKSTITIDSTGFQAVADIGSPQAHYLAIKWLNPAQVRVAIDQIPFSASTGIQSFNSFGFTPDVVLGGQYLMTSLDSVTDGATASAGGYFVTGRHGSRAIAVHHREGLVLGSPTPTTEAASRQGAHALLLMDHLGSVVAQADWVGGSGSGGFRLDFTTASQGGHMTALGIQIIPSQVIPRRQEARLATRPPRIARRTVLPLGVAAAPQVSSLVWRAIQRFRRKMQERLRWRPRPELPLGVEVPFPATGQESEGGVFVAGARRAQILSGGAEEGAVL